MPVEGKAELVMQAHHLVVQVKIDELIIVVTEGAHKKLYNRFEPKSNLLALYGACILSLNL
eukprot:SAG11_NODE_3660_length_2303_cov_1.401089_4_plen_61_part_00